MRKAKLKSDRPGNVRCRKDLTGIACGIPACHGCLPCRCAGSVFRLHQKLTGYPVAAVTSIVVLFEQTFKSTLSIVAGKIKSHFMYELFKNCGTTTLFLKCEFHGITRYQRPGIATSKADVLPER